MLSHLKVKIKSLATEATYIRKQEKKAKPSRAYRRAWKSCIRNGMPIVRVPDGKINGFRVLTNKEREYAFKAVQSPSVEQVAEYNTLHDHRIKEVRTEARSAFLAYGFLRNREYYDLEENARRCPNWDRIEQIVKKFGTKEDLIRLKYWRQLTEWAKYGNVEVMEREEGLTGVKGS